MSFHSILRALVAAVALGAAAANAQQPFSRPTPNAGAVLTTKGGEELRFDAEPAWRHVVPQQALNGGDTVRTNSFGSLALLFADQTQVRVGRNSVLLVKEIARSSVGETVLSLANGVIFSRATRGGSTVRVETAAATAGVRGTEWSLSAQGKTTTLAVMEGAVALTNPQGSVLVGQGEGGEAVVGQAPRKIKLVDFDGRQQLLLYRELRDFFFFAPASDIGRQAQRKARRRILAMPAARRSTDDILTLAEAELTYDGTRRAAATLDGLGRRRLGAAQTSRVSLLRGYIAARDSDWPAAERWFRRAMPHLDPSRRGVAALALWTAAAAARPTERPPPMPDMRGGGSDPATEFARAQTESFVDSAKRGAEILEDALRRHPDNALLRAGRAMMLLTDAREDEAKAEIEAGLRLDPDEPLLLSMRARYRRVVSSEIEGARADLLRAVEIAPGNQHVWMELGLVERARKAPREADRAFRKAVELNPDNSLILASYALFLVTSNRLPEADVYLRRAENVDPTGLLSLAVRARLLDAQGRYEDARGKYLAAAAVNPSYADVQTSLAVTSNVFGDAAAAAQALDDADRYDPDNLGTPLIRSIIARDNFEADTAVIAAREAVKRSLARGGDYTIYETDRNNGSPVNSALRFIGLNEWGRFYGDCIFDPFRAGSYFDQGAASRPSIVSALNGGVADQDDSVGPTSFSAAIQGLLLDPMSASASRRRANVYHTTFAETTVGGLLNAVDGKTGWGSNVSVQGKLLEPVPVAVSLDASLSRPDSPFSTDRERLTRGSAFIGIQPTAFDNLVLFSNHTRFGADDRFVDLFSIDPDREKSTFSTVGLGWSHEFAYRNVLQAAVTGQFLRDRVSGDLAPDTNGDGLPNAYYALRDASRTRSGGAAISHLVGVGDVSLRYGIEGDLTRSRSSERRDYVLDGVEKILPSSTDGRSGLAYADAIWDMTRDLKVEGGVFGNDIRYDTRARACVLPGDLCAPAKFLSDDRLLNARVGVAWRPFTDHWLRAVYRRDTTQSSAATLAPLATVGIQPNELPTPAGAPVKTIALRWDAEWSRHLFTALDYQRQTASEVFSSIPESLNPTFESSATVKRLVASANVWLTHGFGLSLRYARTWSEVAGASTGLAFAPNHAGRVGLTLVSPARVRFTVSQNIVGSRPDSAGERLSSFATTDVSASWTSPGKRLVLGLQALNLFDRRYVVQNFDPIPGIEFFPRADILGRSRTIVASAELRF